MSSQPQLESDRWCKVPPPNRERSSSAYGSRVEPTRTQSAIFCGILLGVCIVAAMSTRGYIASIAANGDNAAYAKVATAIREWKLESVESVKHFWGLPYLAAALSAVFRISVLQAIAGISIASTIASVFLVADLWSGWTAVYFAATNYFVLQFGA